MKLDWQKWGLDFFASLGRHVGTAGMTWLGLGLKDGKVDWHNLWVAVLVGGILPTFFTFLQKSPTPDAVGGAPAVAPAPDVPKP